MTSLTPHGMVFVNTRCNLKRNLNFWAEKFKMAGQMQLVFL